MPRPPKRPLPVITRLYLVSATSTIPRRSETQMSGLTETLPLRSNRSVLCVLIVNGRGRCSLNHPATNRSNSRFMSMRKLPSG